MTDDLISRQEVDKIIDDMLENDNLQASPLVWHGLHMIKQLPSAQPTVEAIPVEWIKTEAEKIKETAPLTSYAMAEILRIWKENI